MTKRVGRWAVVACLLCGYQVQMASAALLFDEPFSQNGTMASGIYSSWTSVSGTGNQLAVTAANGLEFGPSDRDYTRAFTPQTGPVYFGVDVTPQSLPTSGSEYWLALSNGTSYVGRFFLTAVNSGSNYDLGISVNGGSATVSTSAAYALSSQRIVGSYNPANGDISLWAGAFNPASPLISAATSLTTSDIDGLSIRQAGAFDNAASSIYMTNLRVSNDFASAVAVPEPSTVALGGIGLAAAAAAARRRQQVRPSQAGGAARGQD